VPVTVGVTTAGFTVTTAVLKQPAGDIYTIVVVPALMALTTPEVNPTVPTAGTELLQVPPAGVAVNVVVVPAQAVSVPEITGVGLTVTL